MPAGKRVSPSEGRKPRWKRWKMNAAVVPDLENVALEDLSRIAQQGELVGDGQPKRVHAAPAVEIIPYPVVRNRVASVKSSTWIVRADLLAMHGQPGSHRQNQSD